MPDITTPPSARPSVLIVDDHPIVLYGLRLVLSQQGLFTVCGDAGNPAQAREAAERLRPDYIILDLVLGGRDKLDLLRDMVRIAPAARILVYSSQSEKIYARRVLQAGARGYVSKMEGLDTVAAAMEVLSRGEMFVSRGLRDQLIEAFIDPVATGNGEISASLSERERQVMRAMRDGRTLGEIAGELGLSTKTIGTYRDRLKTKLAGATPPNPAASALAAPDQP